MIWEGSIGAGPDVQTRSQQGRGFVARVRQPNTFDIPLPNVGGAGWPGRAAAAWWQPVEGLKDLGLFNSISVDANPDGNSIRLSVNPNEEPANLVIRVFAGGDVWGDVEPRRR